MNKILLLLDYGKHKTNHDFSCKLSKVKNSLRIENNLLFKDLTVYKDHFANQFIQENKNRLRAVKTLQS